MQIPFPEGGPLAGLERDLNHPFGFCEPPKPLQPLDCNQLNTCPTSPETNPISCEFVSPTPTVEQEPLSKKSEIF